MPDTYRDQLTGRALADLEGISSHISIDSPQYAAKMIRTLLDAIDGLSILPYRFDAPRGGKSKARNVRSMPVRPYLVRYRIEKRKKLVTVLQVRHGARRGP